MASSLLAMASNLEAMGFKKRSKQTHNWTLHQLGLQSQLFTLANPTAPG